MTDPDRMAGTRPPGAAQRDAADFENLFQHSPVPLMQHDYSELELWMAELRAAGGDIEDELAGGLEAIRRMAAMIRITAANPAAERAVGIPQVDLIGPIDPAIVNEGAREGWAEQIRAVWHRRPTAHTSIAALTADGSEYDADSILSAPIVDGEPDFSRAVFTLVDTTPHRQEERRMSDLVDAKNTALASVSHEIRTPLTALLGFASILSENTDVGADDRTTMIRAIAQQAQEMADLVEDLLVAVRVDPDDIAVETTPVDLAEQIEQTLSSRGDDAADAEMRATDGVVALGDPGRVRQILRNLLTNADRYGRPPICIDAHNGNGRAIIDVSDAGAPLSPDVQERIFEPFEKAGAATDRPDSVGIGLAISRRLAERMNGGLDYLHENGRAIFRLWLPLA